MTTVPSSGFLIAAVRGLLQTHAPTLQQAVARRTMTLGGAVYSRRDLEKVVATGKRLSIRVVGILSIAEDVSPKLARAAIKSVSVFGKFRASPEVKAALLFRQPGKKAEGSRE